MPGKKTNKVIRILSAKERSLFNAINSEDVLAVKQLIQEEGVDVNVQDVFQRTPLIRACLLSSQEERTAIVTLLLKKGADVNLRDNHGRTALMILCREDSLTLPVIQLIMRCKVDLNIQDDEGDSALMHAVQMDNTEAVKVLLGHRNIDVERQNQEGDSPLVLAAKQQNSEICEVLVNEGHADHANVPIFLRKYLPPNCQEASFTKESHHMFEAFRKNAQDVPSSPYTSDTNIPPSEELNKTEGTSTMLEKWKRATQKAKAVNAFEEALRLAQKSKSEAQAKQVGKATTTEHQAKAEAEAQEKAKTKAVEEAGAKKSEVDDTEAQTHLKKEQEPKESTTDHVKKSGPASPTPLETQDHTDIQNSHSTEDQNVNTIQKSNWEKVKRRDLSESRPAPPSPHNKCKRNKDQLKFYKTKSGRTIFPNAPHDKEYDNIAAVREGIAPAQNRKAKSKKGPLLPDIAQAAARKRAVISTN